MSDIQPTETTGPVVGSHIADAWLSLAAQNGLDSVPDEVRDHLLATTCSACAEALTELWAERPPPEEVRAEARTWPTGSTLALAFGRIGTSDHTSEASELALALHLGNSVVEVDPFGSMKSEALVGDSALAARYLALAELRLEAQPTGPWSVDSALQAIGIAEALGETRESSAAIAAFATSRAGEALQCLRRIPEQVLARGGRNLQQAIEGELEPLARWLYELPVGDELREWLAHWPMDALVEEAEELFVAAEAFMHGQTEVKQLPVSPQAVASGLVDSWTLATLEGEDDSDVWEVRLPLSGTLAGAYLRTLQGTGETAAVHNRAATTNAQRDRILLRSLVTGHIAGSPSDGAVPLPTLGIRQFDPETGELLSFTPLAIDSEGTLRGTVPRVAGAVLRADIISNGPLVARTLAAQALATPPAYWVTAAEEAAGLANQISDEATREALLRTAWVLATSGVDSAHELGGKLRSRIESVGLRTPDGLDLWTLGCELQAAILRERASAADGVWHGLGPTFDSLDEETKVARLHKYADTVAHFDTLDSFLANSPQPSEAGSAS